METPSSNNICITSKYGYSSSTAKEESRNDYTTTIGLIYQLKKKSKIAVINQFMVKLSDDDWFVWGRSPEVVSMSNVDVIIRHLKYELADINK